MTQIIRGHHPFVGTANGKRPHPTMVAAMLVRQVPAGDEPILDAGAGTRIMGESLTAVHYGHLVGIDASDGVLTRAVNRGCHLNLHQMVPGDPLEFTTDTFTAVVSAGVFTEGHAPLSALDELTRMPRPGGHFDFSIGRAYLEGAFDKKEHVA